MFVRSTKSPLRKRAGRTKDRRKLKFALLSWRAIPSWSANFSLRFLSVPEGRSENLTPRPPSLRGKGERWLPSPCRRGAGGEVYEPPSGVQTSVCCKLKFALLRWGAIPGWSAHFSLRSCSSSKSRSVFQSGGWILTHVHYKNFRWGCAPNPKKQGKKRKKGKKCYRVLHRPPHTTRKPWSG